MSYRASTIFYILSGFILLAGLFVLQPSRVLEVVQLQTEAKQQFSIAWQQTIGDQPYFSDLAEIWDGVSAFYDQSANHMIALLSPRQSDDDVVHVFAQTYRIFADSFHLKDHKTVALTVSGAKDGQFVAPADFMAEEPLHNIVQEKQTAAVQTTGSVSGATTGLNPANSTNSWITIQDNYTGQPYCLAIYNGEVNKYLGECKGEYH